MAGCAKADRKRKSSANKRYIMEGRKEANKAKAIKRHARTLVPKNLATPRGAGRAVARGKWAKAGGKAAMSFQKFKLSVKG